MQFKEVYPRKKSKYYYLKDDGYRHFIVSVSSTFFKPHIFMRIKFNVIQIPWNWNIKTAINENRSQFLCVFAYCVKKIDA